MNTEEVTEKGLWATVPLMDPANVGKYVHASWNGNRSHPTEIIKIGRTNIHCGYAHSTNSYRVSDDGMTGKGMQSGFGIYCYSNQHLEEAREKAELNKQLDELINGIKKGPLVRLRWTVDLLNGKAVC